ncbi:MAG TPA: hypothetical protein V6C86_18210 [Oculatellaceae cyanobacterium]|jgi:hypothetical protein
MAEIVEKQKCGQKSIRVMMWQVVYLFCGFCLGDWLRWGTLTLKVAPDAVATTILCKVIGLALFFGLVHLVGRKNAPTLGVISTVIFICLVAVANA